MPEFSLATAPPDSLPPPIQVWWEVPSVLRAAVVLGSHEARIRIQEEEDYRAKLRSQKQGLMDDLLAGRVRAMEMEAW